MELVGDGITAHAGLHNQLVLGLTANLPKKKEGKGTGSSKGKMMSSPELGDRENKGVLFHAAAGGVLEVIWMLNWWFFRW
uniref:Uncharacterized protein n=1 Tax=Solanum lycopersicum TaxID=4081 RepID=K4D707_SOLLC